MSGVSVVTATGLQAQQEKTLAFDFTANPVPIEATDLFGQFVFKPNAGEDVNSARWIEPTSFGLPRACWNIKKDES